MSSAVGLLRTPEARLVTLTGPGGIGKTRVGVEVAHRLAADHPDGVWFVGLDAVRDHRLVARAIADTLGVDEVGGDVVVPLTEHLRSRRLLLVLDNFEQVEDAAPLVADLLAAAPGLKVLVTSRVRLRLYGEHARALDPLPIADAVPLFLERARSVDHRFEGESADVADLCEHLDRIPLAIELVAARVDEVPVASMLSELRARRALDLASHGPRERSARQQTLRSAIDWSVALLPPGLATGFARLGVFVGGFSEEAARAVAEVTEGDLATLVRAGLVDRPADGRHRLMETVREYAVELLADEGPTVQDAHAQWFHDLAVASVGGLRGPEATTWRGRLDAERANCRAALARLEETADREVPRGTHLLRAAAGLGLYWYRTGAASEDTAWLERALAAAPDAEPTLRGEAEYALAICLGEQGHSADALTHSRTAYQLLRDASDPAWAARALNTLAGLTRDLGHAEEAAQLLDQAIALRRALDGRLGITVALANRAIVALDLGDVPTARSCLQECLATEGEDELEVAFAEAGLADVELADGDPDRSAQRVWVAVEVLAAHGQDSRVIECFETLAALAVVRGQPELAATLVAAADRALEEQGAVQVPADAAIRARRTGAALAALDDASRAAAEQRGRSLDVAAALALARRSLG